MDLEKYFDWEKIKEAEPALCRDCDSLEEAISRCVELHDLFSLWRWAQAYERGAMESADDLRHSTFPDLKKYHGNCVLSSKSYNGNPALKKAMRDHFCPDGFLKGDGYDADTLTVLFVFRESNISDDVTLEDGQITLKQADGTDKAWLKKQWDKVEGSERKDPYVSFMEQYVSFIEQHIQSAKADYTSIERIAAMNLNKRGGFGTCGYARLRHYAEVYKLFIGREIAIIDPGVIICGGTFGTVKELLPNELANRVKVWDCYHPRSRRDQDAGQIKKWVFEGSCRDA